ncbi:putative uncharacterized protein DDB_G0290521 [Ostrea edulis]|uniref:putative uncharacterized protein DDB_G0290521 n=1 Tax=Ostrea edulis TaxID=37623 RepID=UPI0020965E5B|nr:putative uncharacterized protein DDB_G0290521 [Ostrea edulis]
MTYSVKKMKADQEAWITENHHRYNLPAVTDVKTGHSSKERICQEKSSQEGKHKRTAGKVSPGELSGTETLGNSPEQTPRNSRTETKDLSGTDTPGNAQEETPRNSPEQTPRNSPEQTPRISPKQTLRNSLEQTPRNSGTDTKDLSEETPRISQEETSRISPEQTSGNFWEQTLSNSKGKTPDELLKKTCTPGNSSRECKHYGTPRAYSGELLRNYTDSYEGT